MELDKVNGIERFRISSIEPNLLSNDIIEFVAQSKKFVPHFHMPLQSGSNRILKLMRRRYLKELYNDRVEKIKSLMPLACIGGDVITGFPGETDDDFMETHEFINNLDISYLHVFPYSERANTLASGKEGRLPQRVRHERCEILRGLSVSKRRKFYEHNLGCKVRVLFESDVEKGRIFGFTENYIRTETKYDPLLINEIRTVRLKDITPEGYVTVAEPEEENMAVSLQPK